MFTFLNYVVHLKLIYVNYNSLFFKKRKTLKIYSYIEKYRCKVKLYIIKCVSAQPWLTLCDTMDCSLPDSSVYRILQARILEWVTIPTYMYICICCGILWAIVFLVLILQGPEFVRSKRDTDVKDRLLDFVGEGEGGMIWENGIETCLGLAHFLIGSFIFLGLT